MNSLVRRPAILSVICLTVLACGGAAGTSPQASGPPRGSVSPTATPVAPSETAAPSPDEGFEGTARASVTVGDRTFEYSGECSTGVDDSWFVLNAGSLGGDYLGVLAGRHPAAGPDAPSSAGGGTFDDPDVLVTVSWGDEDFLAKDEIVTLVPDLSSGEFEATLWTGGTISGSFSC